MYTLRIEVGKITPQALKSSTNVLKGGLIIYVPGGDFPRSTGNKKVLPPLNPVV